MDLCRVPYVLRFGGKGYLKLAQEGYIWKTLISKVFSRARGGIIKGKTMKWDVNSYISDDRLLYLPSSIEDHPPNSTIHVEKEALQVLFLSNLIPSKGPFEVLRAAKIVLEKRPDVRFIMAGADLFRDFTKRLKSYISRNGLEDFICMPGPVHGNQKASLMASSDIFVFPTYYEYEVFGTVNIEAMSWGLPVISSNEAGIPDIVLDGVTGFLVNPKDPEEIADKILTLVEHPDLRKAMGKKGREEFENKYTFQVYEKNLDAILHFFLNCCD